MNTNKSISDIKQVRQTVLNNIEGLSIAQLNAIPDGFNNNIIWNLGHLIAAQQGVCYKRAGLPIVVDDDFFESYKPGSKPERFLGEDEFGKIKSLLFTSMDKLNENYAQSIFDSYPAWVTRYGVNIASIDEAVVFLLFHEGLHAGVITALKKLVINQAG